MNTENSFASQNDEAVFDNRNKSYGAFSIRKSYSSSLTKGTGGSLLVAGFFIATLQAALLMAPKIPTKIVDPIFTGTLIPIPNIKRNIEQRRVHQELRTNAALPPRAVSTPVDPPIEEPTQPANNGEDIGEPNGTPSQVGTGIDVSSARVVVEPPKTLVIAEVMPEFEGGAKAMYKFLRKHLRYPHTDQQGTVFVQFVIDITGTVTGVEVVRGINGLLDKEASRVIAIMPKWKPASQHGSPVNVRMVLPIKFEMEKE